MSIATRIKAAQGNRTLSSVEVAEWPDDDGKPTVIYFTEITVGESIPLAKAAQEGGQGNLAAVATVIAEKALDENGKHMFDRGNLPDHIELLKKEPMSVVMPIFEAMMQTEDVSAKN